MSERICAWVTRHKPTPEQLVSLSDYRRISVQPRRGFRFQSSVEVWAAVLRHCGGTPDLIVAVLPALWGADFLALAAVSAPTVPVLRALMIPPAYSTWSGVWLAFDHTVRDWYEWKLEEVRHE